MNKLITKKIQKQITKLTAILEALETVNVEDPMLQPTLQQIKLIKLQYRSKLLKKIGVQEDYQAMKKALEQNKEYFIELLQADLFRLLNILNHSEDNGSTNSSTIGSTTDSTTSSTTNESDSQATEDDTVTNMIEEVIISLLENERIDSFLPSIITARTATLPEAVITNIIEEVTKKLLEYATMDSISSSDIIAPRTTALPEGVVADIVEDIIINILEYNVMEAWT